MPSAARAAYPPRPSSLAALLPPPTIRNGGRSSGVHGAPSIIAKSSPDNHLQIEANTSELRTGKTAPATCNRPQTRSTPWPVEVIEEMRQ
jgi:hypothetical protein